MVVPLTEVTMSETMRGMRLGSQSLESDKGVELSARQLVEFKCPKGHEFSLAFAEGVELPLVWQCQRCQASARRLEQGMLVNGEGIEEVAPRTHYEMVKERRSEQELEQLLEEMLVSMRKRRAQGQVSA